MLLRASEYCDVANSIIFCPYAYKAFFPVVTGDRIPKDAEIDYRYEENKIPAIRDHTLMWNVHIRSMTAKDREDDEYPDPDRKTPYGDKVRYVYRFEGIKRLGRLACVVPEDDAAVGLRQIRNDDGIEMQIDTDKVRRFFGLFCREIDRDECSRSKVDIYSNEIDELPIPNRRIISRGDLENLLYQFNDLNGMSVRCSPDEHAVNRVTVKRYAEKYRLDRPDRLFRGDGKMKKIWAKFASEQDVKFFDDYVNYVLMYLEHYHPDYEWVGVR